MGTLLNATILSPARFPIPSRANPKAVKARAVRCLRKNGDADGLPKLPSPFEEEDHDHEEMSREMFRPSDSQPNERSSDIWKLFKEAQQNILYLNKQRLVAIEELKTANKEKELLLDRLEQLEAEKPSLVKKDKQSFYWELLLRIDSMVLSGMIGAAEASELRKMVLSNKYSIADIFLDIMQKSDAELLAELRHFDGRKQNEFHIIHICTEMAPLVVGSMASYVTGLSHALQKKGHMVEVILPKYAFLDLSAIQGLREIEAESYSYFNGQLHGNKIWTGIVHGIGVTLIQPLFYSSLFNREKLYGYSDDFERFTYFSRASLDYIAKSGKRPNVLHIHNWETAIVGPLFWDIFVNQGLGDTRILLTCHGFDSQCLEQPEKLGLCGLDPARLHRPDRLQDNAKTHLVNILKGGIVYSNKVVMVSSIHSKHRIIHSFSHGLEPTLAFHKDKLIITPCGFDNSIWDPYKDRFLPENYSAEDIMGKAVCKVALQKQLGLPENSSSPLVGCIFSDFTDIDVNNVKLVVWSATRKDVQFIFMGSEMASLDRTLASLRKELEGETVKFINKYDETLSHLIFAGSDIVLCQSFHDPLNQLPLKALKYGAAPLALTPKENVPRHFTGQEPETTKFSEFISSYFGNMSLSEALDEMKRSPSNWKQRMVGAMRKDFSWDAECYDIHVSAYTSIKKL